MEVAHRSVVRSFSMEDLQSNVHLVADPDNVADDLHLRKVPNEEQQTFTQLNNVFAKSIRGIP